MIASDARFDGFDGFAEVFRYIETLECWKMEGIYTKKYYFGWILLLSYLVGVNILQSQALI